MQLISHCLTPGYLLTGIRSLIGFGNLVGPLAHSVLYLRRQFVRGYTSIYFEENQLSPSLISLSLLSTRSSPTFSTVVGSVLQAVLPASSTWHMDRSLRFRVYRHATERPVRTRFRYGSTFRLNLATQRNSQAHYAKGTRSHIRLAGIVLPLLVGVRFQVLFHSPHRGSFHLSLAVLVHYRSVSSI